MTNLIIPTKVPASINPLSPNGFMFSINKLPELEYFCQDANIPGITLGEAIQATSFVMVPVPGEMITYDTLNIKFLVDENMANYIAIHNWIIALGFPENNSQYIDFIDSNQQAQLSELAKNYSSGVLQILGNTNNPIKNIDFIDLFPINLGTVSFQSTNQDVQYIVGDATFRYSYYKFSSLI